MLYCAIYSPATALHYSTRISYSQALGQVRRGARGMGYHVIDSARELATPTKQNMEQGRTAWTVLLVVCQWCVFLQAEGGQLRLGEDFHPERTLL